MYSVLLTNLPDRLEDETLRRRIEERCGGVRRLLRVEDPDVSDGLGAAVFVDFATRGAAVAAREALDDRVLAGRRLHAETYAGSEAGAAVRR